MKRERKLLLVTVSLIITFSAVKSIEAKKIIDETVSVPALGYRWYSFSTNEDLASMYVSIDTFFSDITVAVMDSTNFQIYESGGTADCYFLRVGILEGDYNFDLGPAGIYYLVLQNDGILFDATVDIYATVTTTFENTTIGIIVAGIVVIALIAVAISRSRRRTTPPPVAQQLIVPGAQPPPPAQYTQPVQTQAPRVVVYCPECGSQLKEISSFCPNCGKKMD